MVFSRRQRIREGDPLPCWHLGEEEEGRVPKPCSIPKSLLRYYPLQFLGCLEMLASGEDASGKVWRLVLVYAKADEPDAEVVLRLGVAYQKLPLFDAQFRFPESDYPSDMGWCPCTFGQ